LAFLYPFTLWLFNGLGSHPAQTGCPGWRARGWFFIIGRAARPV